MKGGAGDKLQKYIIEQRKKEIMGRTSLVNVPSKCTEILKG